MTRLGWMAISAVALLFVATLAIAVLAFPVPRFPEPTGPFHIGTRTYHWVDTSRPEPFTTDPDDHRELMAQVWYPSDVTLASPAVPYIDHHEVTDVWAGRFHVPALLLSNIRRAPTHAVADARPAAGRFPVLVNPAGLGAFRNSSLFWIEDVTSHGYVVVTLDQPGTAAATVFPDGRVIPLMADRTLFDQYMPLALSRASDQSPVMHGVPLPGGVIPFLAHDLRFALSQLAVLDQEDVLLAGHLDTTRAGVFGMSLGGYSGPEACRQDARFRACLAVDAGQTVSVAMSGLTQPVLIMSRDADVMRQERAGSGGWPEHEIAHTLGDERAVFQHARADAYFLTMNTMYHVNWTDAPILTPLMSWLGLTGPIDPYRGFAATNAYTVAFFDRYLKAQRSTLLDDPTSDWPEVKVERREATVAEKR